MSFFTERTFSSNQLIRIAFKLPKQHFPRLAKCKPYSTRHYDSQEISARLSYALKPLVFQVWCSILVRPPSLRESTPQRPHSNDDAVDSTIRRLPEENRIRATDLGLLLRHRIPQDQRSEDSSQAR